MEVALLFRSKRGSGYSIGDLVFGELGTTAEEVCRHFIACWRYAVKKAGSDARPHDLRHTWGSTRRRSHSLEDVAGAMGISAATARTYLDHEKADLARRVFGKPGTKLGTNAARSGQDSVVANREI